MVSLYIVISKACYIYQKLATIRYVDIDLEHFFKGFSRIETNRLFRKD